jgi:glycosyltransferase involved in cell wall biosynthesis
VDFCINGKFLLQPLTGVQRTGREMLAALDRALVNRPAPSRWRLFVPEGAVAPKLSAIDVVPVPGPRNLHAWEQLTLARAAGRLTLINLCGSAPAFAPYQVNVLHDAAVFDCPEAYTPLFVAWYRWLFRRLARRGMVLLTVSEFSRQRLASALCLPPDRIAVIGNGADHMTRIVADPTLRRAQGLDEVPYLIVVSSRQSTKNHTAVLNAWRRLGRHDARLVIVGTTNDRVFKREPFAEVPGVVHLGSVDDTSLKALLQGARGLVFPSLYEGFGLPPIEAMACECPVLVSNAAALPEVCGDAALYADPRAEADLARSMSRLLDDASLRADLVMRGRGRVAHWRWDDCAARLLSAIGS